MPPDRDMEQDFARAAARLARLAETDSDVAEATQDAAVTASLQEPGLSYPEIIARVLTGYASRRGLGSRRYEIRDGQRHFLPAFDTITYGELGRQVESAAAAMLNHPGIAASPGDFACFIAFTSAEMVAADLACAYARLVAVPLQANLPPPDMQEVLSDTAPTIILATLEHAQLAAQYVRDTPSVRCLIILDTVREAADERSRLDAIQAGLSGMERSVAVLSFEELVAHGKDLTWAPPPPHPEGPDAMVMLMYTSGSTGTPKGAMIHEAMCNQLWTTALELPSIQLSYAPLNHFMGRNIVHSTLARGGRINFTLKSDMSSLFEDLRITRPTFVMFMPRVAEITYQHYLSAVQRRVAEGEDKAAVDASVRAEMARDFFGDRVVAGAVGSAPTTPEAKEFLRDCFDIAFFDGYSTTEASSTGIISGGRIQRNVVLDYKLIDVPELGYLTTDKPHPRGELLLKSRIAFKGYFRRPEATAKVIDAEGWIHTGDIMVETGPDQLQWLDRRNNVIKLSQAEYVAVGPLEATLLGNSELIRQIYIYGSSYRSFLLAVVVPDTDVARAQLHSEATPAQLRDMARADLQQATRKAGLKSFEIPRDVLVELEPFTHENGLLSSVSKPLRPKLKEKYQDALEAIYQAMERQQQAELADLRSDAGSDLPTLERVNAALKATLGLASVSEDGGQSFADVGGDSLGSVSFSLLLEEIFGVDVPASVILGPGASTARIAQFIDNQISFGDGDRAVSFETVHGAAGADLQASDLTLGAFLPPDIISKAQLAAPPRPEPHTVLLTGATGFLGRFLCLEWLERLAPTGGKVICLVRASSGRDGRDRIAEGLGPHDPELARRFAELAKDHLELIPADFAAPRLDLSETTWDRLAQDVDRIVHCGALVNHVLGYRDLFAPNVAGTAWLLGLALSRRQKSFDFISTYGVPQVLAGLHNAPEDADIRSAAPTLPAGPGYALGYIGSKWASEVLLRQAHEQFGLPVTVFRPDMILPHSRFTGQLNPSDMFIRLLFSVIRTGLAPVSFYRQPSPAERSRAHYEGLPVDFLASAIVQIGLSGRSGFRCFNTTSSHVDDGVSLDTLIDWIESAYQPLTRIADYSAWAGKFRERLETLPPEERQQSSLPILAQIAVPQSPAPAPIRNDAFVAAVRGIRAGPEVPGLSEAYLHKVLRDMHLLGLAP